MKKRFLSFLIALVMALSLVPVTAFAAEGGSYAYTPKKLTSDYFYKQLNPRSMAIYNKLLHEFSDESTKADYYEGTKFIDLMEIDEVDDAAVEAYLAGNKDLYNDFCAAKDALDLDHSELWYIDSGYLSFHVTKEGNGDYHVLIGPGRGKTYLLGGQEMQADQVKTMDENLEKVLKTIEDNAIAALNAENAGGTYSDADIKAVLVRSVHDSVTRGLSYRYETECVKGDEPYIRTLYALYTKQGVCEAYSRAMQVILTRLGVECVLIHGIQTKGPPENHMWNAVNIPDDSDPDTSRWYVVDATWDDPVPVDWYGKREIDNTKLGNDETETVTYLMVGQNVVGEYWQPSGYVSTGNFEFKYPKIETSSYNGSTAYGDKTGLKVDYSVAGSVEGIPAGVFTVSFQGMNMAESAEKGYYFLIRMYDMHADGTSHVMHEWYYANAALLFLAKNDYFYDGKDGLHVYTGTCEYVEIAVTTRKPDDYDEWANRHDWSYTWEQAFYNGDGSDFVAQSDMLYNSNASYEAPPYVFRQTPAPNVQGTAGYDYRFDVTFDDELYHPVAGDAMSIDDFTDNSSLAAVQEIRVSYTTIQQDLRTGGDMIAVITGDLPFDKDRDGYVDMPNDGTDNTYVDFQWHYVYGSGEGQKSVLDCPKNVEHDPQHKCDVKNGCRVDGVSFNFRASDMWQDDITEYRFQLEGLVGSRSNKFANSFGVICAVPGLCPACYRSQGIDWNLWGKPTLLDAPENLDLAEMARKGGTDEDVIDALEEQMNTNGFNGRLMLVVEDKTPGAGNREDYQRIENALEDSKVGKELEGQEVVGRSVFEINFNRICPMVKLKPGQSLRVQVGYPAGITYDMLTGGDSEVELKAYHFTRCDADHPCGNEKKEGHAWGDDIVGVNEITLIPTPYGMVIMCDAFSPFEIVAVKKTADSSAAAVADPERTLIVVSDGNGVVKVNGVEAVGQAGNIPFHDDTKVEFQIEAVDGFAVESVSLGGESIDVSEDGTFTVTGAQVKSNDVLNVSFIPSEVKTAEIQEFGETQVAKVCPHNNRRTETGKAATCTENGATDTIVCEDCGTVLQASTVIPATGHSLKKVTDAVAPTCTANGSTAEMVCENKNCDYHAMPATVYSTGHQFTDYTTQSLTCQGALKTATCDICHNAVNQVLDTNKKGEHSYTVPYGTKTAATCKDNRVDLLKCEWCESTKDVEVLNTTTDHTPDEQGICTVCHTYVCQSGHTLVTDPAVDATCTENGKTERIYCSKCTYVEKESEVIPAQGHTFDEPHGHCTVCGAEAPQVDHTPEIIPAVDATCEGTGLSEGKRCSVCKDIIERQETTPALGHDWIEASAVWTWSDDHTSASVTLTCSRDDSHKETFSAEVTKNIVREATCDVAGEEELVAKVTVDGKTYENKVEHIEIPTLEHTVTEWTPDTDATCLVHGHDVGTCDVCGADVKRERTELLPHSVPFDGSVETSSSCTESADRTGVCVFCGETVTVSDPDAPALGHSYGSYHTVVEPTCTESGLALSTCSRCGSYITKRIPALGHNVVDDVCTRCGTTEWPSHPVVSEYVPFTDVPDGIWYEDDLKYAFEHGIVYGTSTTEFSPEKDISRVELMTMLARFDFVADASGEHWKETSLDWAVKRGISDGTDPDNSITREQLVTMLWRYFNEPESDIDLSAYEDAGEISNWAEAAMKWAVDMGIIVGVSQTQLDPHGLATRAQAVTIFARFTRLIEK